MGGRFSYAGRQGSTPWIAYIGLVVFIQGVLRMAMMEAEEGKSMEKLTHPFKLFVFSVIETTLAIQINVISNGLTPFS